jgi:hypothetical protein
VKWYVIQSIIIGLCLWMGIAAGNTAVGLLLGVGLALAVTDFSIWAYDTYRRLLARRETRHPPARIPDWFELWVRDLSSDSDVERLPGSSTRLLSSVERE